MSSLGAVAAAGTGRAEYNQQLGLALQLLGSWRLDDAGEALKLAVGLEPARPEAFNLLGVVADLGGRSVQAERYFRASLALDPRFPPARHNLARGGNPDLDLELGPPPGSYTALVDPPTPPATRRTTLQAIPASGSVPYRTPEPKPPERRALRRIGPVLLLLGGTLAAVAICLGSHRLEQRAITAIPASERQPLYRRTVENLGFCKNHSDATHLRSFCLEQATLAPSLPECGESCLALVRSVQSPSR